ncbi:MAG: gamma-glutamyl-phosphate reductase, partial [Tatlockia sp.]|nr:gamma-glutamyl-phosphate reductase [Tatlockia sp.]
MNILKLTESAKKASRVLALATSEEKNKALQSMANAIKDKVQQILTANQKDMRLASQQDRP